MKRLFIKIYILIRMVFDKKLFDILMKDVIIKK